MQTAGNPQITQALRLSRRAFLWGSLRTRAASGIRTNVRRRYSAARAATKSPMWCAWLHSKAERRSATLTAAAGMSGNNQPVICNMSETEGVNGTLQAKPNGGTSYNLNNVVHCGYVVRRLTPLECERLQGFPDGWTQIGKLIDYVTEYDESGNEYRLAVYEYTDEDGKRHKVTDSSRYKALGNSIAIPPWFYVLQRLSSACGVDKTMASLFDGIGGFPLIWSGLHGADACVWASEIEAFPIAVTQAHFAEGEQDAGI